MIEVKRDFSQRKDEINTSFNFLENILNHNTIIWSDNSKEKISLELRGIMKANIFLMLYNLTESSISAAIEQIHFSIKKDEETSFDNIKEGIKIKLLKYLKNKKSIEKFVNETNEISKDIILHCFNRKELFSGNVGRNEITELAKEYGFFYRNSDYKKTKHGEKLDKVKEHRNELAHGDFSFKDIGKDYTLSDIREFKNEIIAYLEQIIVNIEKYIKEKAYKTE